MAIESTERYRRYRRYFVNLNRFYEKKQIRVYTGVVLSLFAVSFFLFFAIRPTFITIANLLKEVEDKKIVAEKLQKKIDNLKSAQAEYQRFQKKLYLVDHSLPINSDFSSLVRQIETLARTENVVIQTLQFQKTPLKGETLKTPQVKDQSISGVNFNLNVAGSYDQLISFLKKMTQLRRIILIEKYSFQTKVEENSLDLNLSGVAGFLTPDQETASDEKNEQN